MYAYRIDYLYVCRRSNQYSSEVTLYSYLSTVCDAGPALGERLVFCWVHGCIQYLLYQHCLYLLRWQ